MTDTSHQVTTGSSARLSGSDYEHLWTRYSPILGVLPFLVLVLSHWPDLPAIQAGDYAQYLLHAKALVEGRPYGDIGYLFTDYNAIVGPRLQPPGWPLLLAPWVAFFGTGLLIPKLLVTLAACLFLWAVAVRIGRDEPPAVAVFTAAACGVALESSFATNSALSDLPFASAIWGVILVADTDRPLSWRRAIALGLVGTFAMSIRVQGAALVPAFALLALVRPRDRRVLVALVGSWVVLGLLVLAAVGVDRVPFLVETVRSPAVIWHRISEVVPRYQYALLEALLYPTPWNGVNDAYHVAILVVAAPGLVTFLRRFWRSSLACIAFATAAMLLVAPVTDSRYIWPLWPILGYSTFAGARTWAAWLRLPPVRAQRLVHGFAAGLVLATTLTSLGRPSPPSLLGNADVQDVLAWVRRESMTAPVRVAFFSPRVLTLETGVPSMPWFVAPPDDAIRELARQGITHVILGDVDFLDRPRVALELAARARPAAFQRVHANGTFEVLRFTAPAARPAGP